MPDSSAAQTCECGADPGDINFDRSICACGSMHYFCNQCGTQAEPCSDEKPSAATTPRTAYLWLVSRPDGSLPKVVRAVNAQGAVLSRFRDDDDHIMWGNVAVWRLGNFPEQYEVTADADGLLVRGLGNPRV